MNKVLFNTLKITFSAIIAIVFAYLFHLDFYISAGIVTILTIQSTKKETIYTALERLIAFCIAILISYITNTLLGYSIISFGVYLLFYIFICQYKKWYASMAVNSVLISHFLTFQSMDLYALINEVLLFVIGVSVGVLANMHLHQDIDYMNALKQEADDQIKHILKRMSIRIMGNVEDYDGECFDRLNQFIVQAKAVSIENENNVVLGNNHYNREYIRMREHQTQVLYEMYKAVRTIDTAPSTAMIISAFLEKISLEYHEDNDCESLIKEFRDIDLKMKEHPLPKDRIEFENRAKLFSLLRLIEEFLEIKQNYSIEKEVSQ